MAQFISKASLATGEPDTSRKVVQASSLMAQIRCRKISKDTGSSLTGLTFFLFAMGTSLVSRNSQPRGVTDYPSPLRADALQGEAYPSPHKGEERGEGASPLRGEGTFCRSLER